MSIFTAAVAQLENEKVLTVEQKKQVLEHEQKIILLDRALPKAMSALQKAHEGKKTEAYFNEYGQVLGQHANAKAIEIAKIRAIQPTWSETAVEKLKAGIELADRGTTYGVGKAAEGVAVLATPLAKQAGNFLGKLGRSFGSSFQEGANS